MKVEYVAEKAMAAISVLAENILLLKRMLVDEMGGEVV